MKVLQVAFNTMNIGGVQKDIIDFAESMPDYHFDVVIFSNIEGSLAKRFKELGGSVFRITEYSGRNKFRLFLELFIKKFRWFFITYKILKKHGPYDVIHSHNQFRSAFTNAAAFFAGVKIRIAHSHNDKPPFEYSFIKKILLNMYRVGVLIFSNVKLACSEGSAKYLYFKAKRAEIILNGTNLNKFDIEKYNYKNNGCANFIHIGRYDKQKNQKFLLEVFSNLLKLMPNSTMKLVGYGEDEDIIKKRIVEDDLIGKVEMLPPDSDIPKLLASSDFMIFPSVYEGFPNVQIEAQIMGVVCFVSDSVTLESDLGLTTYIPLDIKPSQWAETIFNKVKLHDYSLRPTISKIQKERIDVNKLAKRYIEIYNNSQD